MLSTQEAQLDDLGDLEYLQDSGVPHAANNQKLLGKSTINAKAKDISKQRAQIQGVQDKFGRRKEEYEDASLVAQKAAELCRHTLEAIRSLKEEQRRLEAAHPPVAERLRQVIQWIQERESHLPAQQEVLEQRRLAVLAAESALRAAEADLGYLAVSGDRERLEQDQLMLTDVHGAVAREARQREERIGRGHVRVHEREQHRRDEMEREFARNRDEALRVAEIGLEKGQERLSRANSKIRETIRAADAAVAAGAARRREVVALELKPNMEAAQRAEAEKHRLRQQLAKQKREVEAKERQTLLDQGLNPYEVFRKRDNEIEAERRQLALLSRLEQRKQDVVRTLEREEEGRQKDMRIKEVEREYMLKYAKEMGMRAKEEKTERFLKTHTAAGTNMIDPTGRAPFQPSTVTLVKTRRFGDGNAAPELLAKISQVLPGERPKTLLLPRQFRSGDEGTVTMLDAAAVTDGSDEGGGDGNNNAYGDSPPRSPTASSSAKALPGGSSPPSLMTTLPHRELTRHEKDLMALARQRHQSSIGAPRTLMGRTFAGDAFLSTPADCVFSDFRVGEVYRQRLQIVNRSYQKNSFRVVGVPLEHRDVLETTYKLPGYIAPGASSDVLVTFRPKENVDIDTCVEFLADTGSFSVPVRCLKRVALVDLSHDNISFGQGVTVGDTASRTFTIYSQGALDVQFELEPTPGIASGQEAGGEEGWHQSATFTATSGNNAEPATANGGAVGGKNLFTTTGQPGQDGAAPPLDRLIFGAFSISPVTGVIPGYGKVTVTAVFSPQVAAAARLPIRITFLVPEQRRLQLPIRTIELEGTGRNVPVYVSRTIVDFKCCMYDKQYREILNIHNSGKSAMKVIVVKRPEFAGILDITPDFGFVQAGGVFPLTLSFQPSRAGVKRCSAYISEEEGGGGSGGGEEDLGELGEPGGPTDRGGGTRDSARSGVSARSGGGAGPRSVSPGLPPRPASSASSSGGGGSGADSSSLLDSCVLRIPIKLQVPSQSLPVTFVVRAQLTTTDLIFDPPELNFGSCVSSELTGLKLAVRNPGLLPQTFGFLNPPQGIVVNPNGGYGHVLPGEAAEFVVSMQPPIAGPQNFVLSCRSLAGRQFDIPGTAVGVRPPVQCSHNRITMPATCVNDVSSCSIILKNPTDSEQCFESLVPSASGITLSPHVGALPPKGSLRVLVEFQPTAAAEKELHRMMDEAAEHEEVAGEKGEGVGKKRGNQKSEWEAIDESLRWELDLQGRCKREEHTIAMYLRPTTAAAAEAASSSQALEVQELHVQVRTCAVLQVLELRNPPLPYNARQGWYLLDFGPVPVGQRVLRTLEVVNRGPEELPLAFDPLDPLEVFSVLNAPRPILPSGSATPQYPDTDADADVDGERDLGADEASDEEDRFDVGVVGAKRSSLSGQDDEEGDKGGGGDAGKFVDLARRVVLCFSPPSRTLFHQVLVLRTPKECLRVALRGTGIAPQLELQPADITSTGLDMGDVAAPAGSVEKTFSVKNVCPFPLDFSLVSASSGDGSLSRNPNFQLRPAFHCQPLKGSLVQGEECTVTVRFQPGAQRPYFQDVLKVVIPHQLSEIAIPLSGRAWTDGIFLSGFEYPADAVRQQAEDPFMEQLLQAAIGGRPGTDSGKKGAKTATPQPGTGRPTVLTLTSAAPIYLGETALLTFEVGSLKGALDAAGSPSGGAAGDLSISDPTVFDKEAGWSIDQTKVMVSAGEKKKVTVKFQTPREPTPSMALFYGQSMFSGQELAQMAMTATVKGGFPPPMNAAGGRTYTLVFRCRVRAGARPQGTPVPEWVVPVPAPAPVTSPPGTSVKR